MIALHALFKGQVQGVGFRWTVVEFAEKYGIVGTIQNLKNGTVALFAEGKKEEIELFFSAIKESPGFAKITDIEFSYHKATHLFSDFKII